MRSIQLLAKEGRPGASYRAILMYMEVVVGPTEVGRELYAMKEIFTTGEAADICQISQQTIIRCFDANKLKGFRVPGSRFRRIPRDRLMDFMTANQIPLDRLQRSDRGERIKILVVDDDPQIVEIVTEILADDGRFDVSTAATGYEAGVQTREFLPAVILLDYKLPDINGNVVCRTIRENPRFTHIKIIFVSGVINPQEVDELMSLGASDFLQKPFRAAELIERIEKVVGMSVRVGTA